MLLQDLNPKRYDDEPFERYERPAGTEPRDLAREFKPHQQQLPWLTDDLDGRGRAV